MANILKHPRGTWSNFAAKASGGTLETGQLYIITDRNQIALALSASTYSLFMQIAVQSTAPSSPYTGQIWVDTTS